MERKLIILAYIIYYASGLNNLHAQQNGKVGMPGYLSPPKIVTSIKECENSPLNKKSNIHNVHEQGSFVQNLIPTTEELASANVYKIEEHPDKIHNFTHTAPYQFKLTQQSPSFQFEGNNENGLSDPSDAQGAAGLNHFMAISNSEVKILKKTNGTAISQVTLDAFFGNDSTFDPRMFYEPFNNRFVALALVAASGDSRFILAVSQTSDPTGGWYYYTIDIDAANNNWMDFAQIGFNKDWIVISGNIYNTSSGNFNPILPNLFVIRKSDLFAGSSAAYFSWISPIFNLAPTLTYDNSIGTNYLVTKGNGNLSGVGYNNLYKISGPLNAPVFVASYVYGVNSPWASNPNPSCSIGQNYPNCGKYPEQQNSNIFFDITRAGSNITTPCVYRNNRLYFVHQIFLPASGTTNRTSLRYWNVNPNNGLVNGTFTIDDASGTVCSYYPSIMVNASEDIAIGHCYSTSSIYQSASCFSVDVNNNYEFFDYKLGEEVNNQIFNGYTGARTGDYGATFVDPDDHSIWTINQVSSNVLNSWETWVGLLPDYNGCFSSISFGNGSFNGIRKNETSGVLTSQDHLYGSAIVDYDAGTLVNLLPGFRADNGTRFHAYIDGCGGTKFQNSLYQNDLKNNIDFEFSIYPNPFSNKTTIEYFLSDEKQVDLRIYNLQMQLVKTLISASSQQEGKHSVEFNADDLSNGIYLCRLQIGNDMYSKKLVLTK